MSDCKDGSLQLPVIRKVGAIAAGGMFVPDPKGTIDCRIEVQTDSGRAVLNLGREAVGELAEELQKWLRVHGSR